MGRGLEEWKRVKRVVPAGLDGDGLKGVVTRLTHSQKPCIMTRFRGVLCARPVLLRPLGFEHNLVC